MWRVCEGATRAGGPQALGLGARANGAPRPWGRLLTCATRRWPPGPKKAARALGPLVLIIVTVYICRGQSQCYFSDAFKS